MGGTGSRRKNREPIEAAIASAGIRNIHPVYFDLPDWARRWKKGQRGIHLYYALAQQTLFFRKGVRGPGVVATSQLATTWNIHTWEMD